MSCLLNKKAVREFALAVSDKTGRRFERVSAEFLAQVEDAVKTTIRNRVHSAKDVKTLPGE